MERLDTSHTPSVTEVSATSSKRIHWASHSQAQAWLQRTWEWIEPRHPSSAARAYIQSHWSRYTAVLARLPPLYPHSRVLEVGASMVSSALRLAGAQVSVAYHALEPEWEARFREERIEGVGLDLLRDRLPWEAETFDLILCDQVLEHLPLQPDFLMRQMFWLLKPGGRLFLSVPNFATWEKRIGLLRGRNPQDLMDPAWVYYAHHREPVMSEVLDWVRRNGGKAVHSEWTDFAPESNSVFKRAGWLRPLLRKGDIGPLLHQCVPSLRDYLVVQAERAPGATFPEEKRKPPMADSPEFTAKGGRSF
jgi:SAM-dependent methyltransferase